MVLGADHGLMLPGSGCSGTVLVLNTCDAICLASEGGSVSWVEESRAWCSPACGALWHWVGWRMLWQDPAS